MGRVPNVCRGPTVVVREQDIETCGTRHKGEQGREELPHRAESVRKTVSRDRKCV